MRKGLKYILPTAIAVLVLAAGFYYFNVSEKKSPSGQQTQDAKLQVCKAEIGDIADRISIAGKLQPVVSANVASQVGGRLKKIAVKPGDRVEQGQVLLELNEREMQSKIETARVKYFKALAKLTELEKWESAPTYLAAKYQVANTEADYEEAKRTYEDDQTLYDQKAISKADLNRSEREMKRIGILLETAKTQLKDQAKKGDQLSLNEARAEHNAAEIELKEAEATLKHKEITAPCGGVVSFVRSSSTTPGSNETMLVENRAVNAGEVLLKIESDTQFAVEGRLNEYDVYRVSIGQPCEIQIPALPGSIFDGTVAEIYPVTGRDNRTYYEIRCPIGQTDEPLKPGLSAEISIILQEKTDAVLIPISALAVKSGKKGVFLINDGVPVFKAVAVGLKNSDQVEVTSGLSAGQDILCQIPFELLTPGK
jgi:HlyD family secretion protein